MRSNLKSKVIVGAAWLIFLATWMGLLVHTVLNWRSISTDIHYDLVGLLLFFGVLWIRLIPRKDREYELLVTSLALASVVDMARRLV